MPAWTARTAALALLGVLSACDREFDLSDLSVTELVEHYASIDPTSGPYGDRLRISEELRVRPNAAEPLLKLLEDPRDEIREIAARALGWQLARREALSELARKRVVRALEALLVDHAERVRLGALVGLGSRWWYGFGPSVRPVVLACARDLLESADEQVASEACEIVARMGADAEPLAPSVLSLAVSADFAARFFAALALGAVGTATPDVLDALWRLLGDEDAVVRAVAADALGFERVRDGRSIPLLLRVAQNTEEDWLVRRSAALSLVDLVVASSDVGWVIEFYLQNRERYQRDEFGGWCLDLGRLGARAVGSSVTEDVERALRQCMQDHGLEGAAGGALGLMACASADLELAQELLPDLWLRFEWFHTDLKHAYAPVSREDLTICEVLISMARWEELDVETDQLADVLERVATEGEPWDQHWAREQLRVLKEPR